MQTSLCITIFVIWLVPEMFSLDRKQERANLIKKHLKRLKKQEGALKLIGGRGEYEGGCSETQK